MAELNAKIEVDTSAAAQKALTQFAKDIYEKYGVTIESVRFDWMRTMDGTAVLLHSEMTTGSQG
jgi:ABC-type metal ion transport system substrate-binding protein